MSAWIARLLNALTALGILDSIFGSEMNERIDKIHSYAEENDKHYLSDDYWTDVCHSGGKAPQSYENYAYEYSNLIRIQYLVDEYMKTHKGKPAPADMVFVKARIAEIYAMKTKFYNDFTGHSSTNCACGMSDCSCGCGDTPPPPPPPEQPSPQGDPGNASPIILDMDNDGIETVGVAEGTHFDLDGNRFAEKSGWVGADDALLIRDRNANGQIDNGGELFGNHTLLANGNKAANGFVALAELDANKDGLVDARDGAVWTQLKLWQDKNGNGVLDAGEMMSMEEAGVAGLNVGYKNQSHTDENGNDHKQVGSFIRDDGSKGTMADVWFKTDLTDTRFMDEIAVNADVAELPNLRGYGNIPSFHQAMALDTSGRQAGLKWVA